jgi:hypothetical protein
MSTDKEGKEAKTGGPGVLTIRNRICAEGKGLRGDSNNHIDD